MSWTKEQVLYLYKQHPCLYVVKSKLHQNKHARQEAWENVLKKLKEVRPVNEINVFVSTFSISFLIKFNKYWNWSPKIKSFCKMQDLR